MNFLKAVTNIPDILKKILDRVRSLCYELRHSANALLAKLSLRKNEESGIFDIEALALGKEKAPLFFADSELAFLHELEHIFPDHALGF